MVTKNYTMKRIILTSSIFFFASLSLLHSQTFKFDKSKLEAVNVSMSIEKLMGREVVKVTQDPTVTQANAPTFAKLKDVAFKNGTIEVKVLSRLLPNELSQHAASLESLSGSMTALRNLRVFIFVRRMEGLMTR